jgi:hypothetical protein
MAHDIYSHRFVTNADEPEETSALVPVPKKIKTRGLDPAVRQVIAQDLRTIGVPATYAVEDVTMEQVQPAAAMTQNLLGQQLQQATAMAERLREQMKSAADAETSKRLAASLKTANEAIASLRLKRSSVSDAYERIVARFAPELSSEDEQVIRTVVRALVHVISVTTDLPILAAEVRALRRMEQAGVAIPGYLPAAKSRVKYVTPSPSGRWSQTTRVVMYEPVPGGPPRQVFLTEADDDAVQLSSVARRDQVSSVTQTVKKTTVSRGPYFTPLGKTVYEHLEFFPGRVERTIRSRKVSGRELFSPEEAERESEMIAQRESLARRRDEALYQKAQAEVGSRKYDSIWQKRAEEYQREAEAADRALQQLEGRIRISPQAFARKQERSQREAKTKQIQTRSQLQQQMVEAGIVQEEESGPLKRVPGYSTLALRPAAAKSIEFSILMADSDLDEQGDIVDAFLAKVIRFMDDALTFHKDEPTRRLFQNEQVRSSFATARNLVRDAYAMVALVYQMIQTTPDDDLVATDYGLIDLDNARGMLIRAQTMLQRVVLSFSPAQRYSGVSAAPVLAARAETLREEGPVPFEQVSLEELSGSVSPEMRELRLRKAVERGIIPESYLAPSQVSRIRTVGLLGVPRERLISAGTVAGLSASARAQIEELRKELQFHVASAEQARKEGDIRSQFFHEQAAQETRSAIEAVGQGIVPGGDREPSTISLTELQEQEERFTENPPSHCACHECGMHVNGGGYCEACHASGCMHTNGHCAVPHAHCSGHVTEPGMPEVCGECHKPWSS